LVFSSSTFSTPLPFLLNLSFLNPPLILSLIGYAKDLLHGKVSEIEHDAKTIFKNVQNPFSATRYHSLVVEPENLPKELEISATSKDNFSEIMGIRHSEYPMEGVQFHPESILTEAGKNLLHNFSIQGGN